MPSGDPSVICRCDCNCRGDSDYPKFFPNIDSRKVSLSFESEKMGATISLEENRIGRSVELFLTTLVKPLLLSLDYNREIVDDIFEKLLE